MKTKYIVLIFFLLGVLTRFPLIEKMQSHWDGPQYSIGVEFYSLAQETPAPPGYPIYIFFGWVFNQFIQNPHLSLLIVNVVFAGLTAGAFFLAGKYIFTRKVGVFAALLFLVSPVHYFFGVTAYPYGLVSFFVLVVAVTVYGIIIKRKEYGLFLGLSYGLFCGIRPQDGLNLFPLVVFGYLGLNFREKMKGFLLFLITIFAWLLPLLILAGGLQNYITQFSIFLTQGALDSIDGVSKTENLRRIVKGLFLTLGIASITLFYFLPKLPEGFKNKKQRKLIIFFSLWIIPGLLSTLFIRNDHSGYQMVYMTALLLLAAYALERLTKSIKLSYLIVAFVLIFNLLWFFRDRDPKLVLPYIQTSFHYSEVVKNDTEMLKKTKYLKSYFNPAETVVIVGSQHFRPVMYHLPNFNVVSYSSFETDNPRYRCFIRRGFNWKRTELRSCDNVAIFPKNIKYLVFFDSKVSNYIRRDNVKNINLGKGLSLYVVPIKQSESFEYNYKLFKTNDN